MSTIKMGRTLLNSGGWMPWGRVGVTGGGAVYTSASSFPFVRPIKSSPGTKDGILQIRPDPRTVGPGTQSGPGSRSIRGEESPGSADQSAR